MIIKFMDRRYEVIQKISAASALDVYAVRDLSEEGHRDYTAACVKNEVLIRRLIPVATRQNISISFKDFHDSFNLEGCYYIFFTLTRGKSLEEALEEQEYSFQERLTIMKNILDRILLLDMPVDFLYEALRKNSMVVDEALEIRFNYFFDEVDYYGQIQEKNCLRRIRDLMEELFRKELTDKSSYDLTVFMRDMKRDRFECVWDCFEEYDKIHEKLMLQCENHEIRPKRFWWQFWEFLKLQFPRIKALLAVLLVLAAGAWLLFHLPNPVLSDEGITFDQIGTLDMETQDTEADTKTQDTKAQE